MVVIPGHYEIDIGDDCVRRHPIRKLVELENSDGSHEVPWSVETVIREDITLGQIVPSAQAPKRQRLCRGGPV